MLKKICQLVRVAGFEIMKVYHSIQPIQVLYKSDNTPVTNADHISNSVIQKGLNTFFPQFPVLSEEECDFFQFDKNINIYWLIDPLDGTKEFLKKNGEFTVNISLINKGIPILGVIYAPFFDVLYAAFNDQAWKETSINHRKRIFVTQSKAPLIVTSRSHIDNKLNDYLINHQIQNYKIKKIGSSLKFGYIAEGTAQIYPRFGNTCIWDTAAGHAVVVSAGGKVQNWNGKELNYLLCSRASLINSGFCVFS